MYAVRNGTLWYWSTGDVGGYSVYLKADDGNTYYYTHLTPYHASWENTTRPVKAGDVIELVNHTGNANGFNHLHFEVRLGGPNGTRVDPEPTLDAAGLHVAARRSTPRLLHRGRAAPGVVVPADLVVVRRVRRAGGAPRRSRAHP